MTTSTARGTGLPRATALTVAATLVLALTGCSHSSSLKLPTTPSPTRPRAAAGVTASSQPLPTASPTPTVIPEVVGQLVLTSGTIDAACVQGTGPVTPVPTSSSNSTSGEGSVYQLLSGGLAILQCQSPNPSVVGFDIVGSKVLWTQSLPQSQNNGSSSVSVSTTLLSGGGKNVYLLTITNTPAAGLSDQVITRTVTALDARSGTQKWIQPLEPNDTTTSNSRGTVDEGSGPAAGENEVIVNVDDHSAFDADSGKPLWRVPKISDQAFYTENDLYLTASNGSLTATDVATGKVAWTTTLQSDAQNINDDRTQTELVGTTLWVFGAYGYDSYDVLDGTSTGHAIYPTSWSSVVATPTHVVAEVDNSIRLFPLTSWSTPVFSVPSSADAHPVALTDQAVVVDAPAGDVLLSANDGSQLQPIDQVPNSVSNADLVDGLELVNNSEVYELGIPQ
jgi:outer membrane protein assembly factor BamB